MEGVAGFAVSFLIHVLIWRLVKPKKQLVWLAGIFVLVPALIYFSLFFILFDKTGLVLSGVLHILFSFAYILSYPAIQAPSPSLKIVREVRAAMPEGLARRELSRTLEADKPLDFCIDNLLEERLLCLKGDKLELTLWGRLVSGLFRNYGCWFDKFSYPGHIRFILGVFLCLAILRFKAYLFLIYGLSAYSYFHIFNMSRTARRIEILGKIGREGIEKQELIKSLNTQDMLSGRLSRLVALNQLEERQGRYILKGRMLLLPAKIAFALRRLLFLV